MRPVLPLLALAAGLLLVHAAAAQGEPDAGLTRYYVSNALGTPLEEVGWYRREEFPYLLVVQQSGQRETRLLLREGEELARWERTPGEERQFQRGELREQRLFDAQGRLREERLYAGGVLESRRVVHYGPHGVSRMETFDGEGRLAFEDRFLLSARGELLRVQRELPGGESQELALQGRAGRVYEERYAGAGQAWVNRYDQEGRLTGRERWQDGRLVERQTLDYAQGTLHSRLSEDLLAGQATLESFDEQGRTAREVVEEGGKRIRETTFTWDELGRLAEKVARGEDGLQQWQYRYAADGSLEGEEYRQRGSLRSVIRYGEGGTRVEELYRDGEVVLRVHFRGGLKLREEILEAGRVIRVKEYP